MAPHFVLEEIGKPFELALVARTRDQHKSPEYLALNPNELIPVLVDGDLVLYETDAICLHLADTHPARRLAPALGAPERARFYTWLMWLGKRGGNGTQGLRSIGGSYGIGRRVDRNEAGSFGP